MGSEAASISPTTLSWVSERSQSPNTMKSCARNMRGLGSAGFRRTSAWRSWRHADRSPARSLSSAALTWLSPSVLDVLGDVPREVGVLALRALVALSPVLRLDLHEVQRERLGRHVVTAGGVRDLVIGNEHAFQVEGQVVERILARLAQGDLALGDVLAVGTGELEGGRGLVHLLRDVDVMDINLARSRAAAALAGAALRQPPGEGLDVDLA